MAGSHVTTRHHLQQGVRASTLQRGPGPVLVRTPMTVHPCVRTRMRARPHSPPPPGHQVPSHTACDGPSIILPPSRSVRERVHTGLRRAVTGGALRALSPPS